jgi:hypothetical protein
MASASPAVANGALLLFAENRRKQLELIDNISSKGRIELGKKLQREARTTFNLNMTDGFALWLTGAWLESMERPGLDAIRTYDTLEQMAHTTERVAYSTQDLMSVDEHWDSYSTENEISRSGTRQLPAAKIKSQTTTPQVHESSGTSGDAKRPVLEILGIVLFVAGLIFFLAKNGTHQATDSSPSTLPSTDVAPSVVTASPAAQPLVLSSELSKDAPTQDVKSNAGNPVSASQKLYLDAVQKMEVDHPELSPKHRSFRKDLWGYVTSRMNDHIGEGYSKHKALQIAVRDLEFRDKAPPFVDLPKTIEAPNAQLPALDKGGHSGFDPACRWVTPQEWSCK